MTTERIDILVNERGAGAAASSISRIGTSSATASAGVVILTGALAALATVKVIKFAADYQTAMVGVQKTTNLSNTAINKLSVQFRELSSVVPKSAAELAGIGEVAGQLGISNAADILTFTETIARIASVTDFTSEAAAESLARLSNIFELPISAVERLGATLNELENTTTATASRLTDFIQRISVAGKQVGLSIADVSGVSATLIDLGFNAELAGTAVSRTFTEMIGNAEVFADQMGISTQEFRANLEKDAIGTITAWAASIQDLPTEQLIQAFEQVGIEGSRARSVFGALVNRTDLLTKNVNTANKAFAEGTSLQKEFETAVKAVNAQFQLATNDVSNLVLGIGEGLLPAVSAIIKEFRDWIQSLDVSEFRLRNIGAFIGGSLIDAINLGIDAFSAIRALMDAVAGTALKVTGNLGLLLVPFANLTDLLGLTSGATEGVLANLNAMDEAGSELLTAAEDRVSKFKTGVVNARIEVETLLNKLDDTKKTGAGVLGAGAGALGAGAATTADTTQGVLPFSEKELKEYRDLLDSAATPADRLAIQIERINELASRPGGFTEQQAQVALIKALEEANEDYINSVEGLSDVLALASTNQQKLNEGLELVAKLLEDGEIDAQQASQAIQNLGERYNEGAAEVEGLSEVLAAANRPIDDLNRQLERTQQLFLDGFIDDEQASLAVERFTTQYNSAMSSLEKSTDDTTKEIQNAINGLANSMESRLTDTFVGFLKGTNDMKEFFTQTIDEIIKQIIRLAVIKPIIDSLFPSGGGAGGAAASFVSSLFGGGGGSSGSVASLPTAPSFAGGGGVRVGGTGGQDSQFRTVNVSPDEIIRVTTPSQERAFMGGGGVNNVSISVVVNSEGSSSTTSEGESNEFALQAGNIIKSTVMDMMRPSEPLGRALANRRS